LAFALGGATLLALSSAALLPRLHAGGPARARAVDYQAEVQPLLAKACGECHGGDKRKAGLDLRDKAAMLRGGETGPALVPGSAEKSLLFQMVRDGKMPPRRDARLTGSQIALLRAWIDDGAQAPETGSATAAAAGRADMD